MIDARAACNLQPATCGVGGLGHNALDMYKDANRYPLHPNVSFPDPLVKAMRRGYRAAVAYVDWMAGNVLQALNTSTAVNSTVVVFMGE
eukprot:SAG31_NODE_10419_length_1140_cov_1.552354_1_plen_89_part_00